jgi:Malate/L-lactate dehydrogenase
MVASTFAMRVAIEKARTSGIGYAGVFNRCHFGAAGYYAAMAAAEDMIGLAMANDTPSVTAPRARGRVTGSDPLAYVPGEIEWERRTKSLAEEYNRDGLRSERRSGKDKCGWRSNESRRYTPASQILTMLGWLKQATAWASRQKRANSRNRGLPAPRIIFRATSRSSTSLLALYTAPIPPRPGAHRTSLITIATLDDPVAGCQSDRKSLKLGRPARRRLSDAVCGS